VEVGLKVVAGQCARSGLIRRSCLWISLRRSTGTTSLHPFCTLLLLLRFFATGFPVNVSVQECLYLNVTEILKPSIPDNFDSSIAVASLARLRQHAGNAEFSSKNLGREVDGLGALSVTSRTLELLLYRKLIACVVKR
jgi:hypothetical protein